MAYQPTPTLQAYWNTFPFMVHFSAVRCPVHRQTWLRMDEIAEEAWCEACDRSWTTAEVVAAAQERQSQPRPAKPRLPDDLRQYYPHGVTCPRCRRRLRLRVSAADGTCTACGQTFTFAQLIDAAAQRLMEEQPNGAQGYRKPRHAR